jgi:hypothetical protein
MRSFLLLAMGISLKNKDITSSDTSYNYSNFYRILLRKKSFFITKALRKHKGHGDFLMGKKREEILNI